MSLFGFVLLWAVLTDAWGYSAHLALRNGSYIYAYLSRLIWVTPAVLLILRYHACLRFEDRALFSRPKRDRSLLAALLGSLLVSFVGMFVTHGGFYPNPTVNIPLEIVKLILVGFVEETVFRGWGYRALAAVVKDQKAVFYSTAFFVLLHWPAYLVRYCRFGTMNYTTVLIQSLTAALLGIIFCRLLKKGKSLWNLIIVHIVYDMLCVLLVG